MEIEMSDKLQGKSCYECPYCMKRNWLQRLFGKNSLCAHPKMLHIVSGKPYIRCFDVRNRDYIMLFSKSIYCLGYFPEEHIVKWSRFK